MGLKKYINRRLLAPGSPLRRMVKPAYALRHPLEYRDRKRLADGVAPDPEKVKLLEERGFLKTTAEDLGFGSQLLPFCLKKIDEGLADMKSGAIERQKGKDYWFELLKPEDLKLGTPVIQAAIQEKVLALAAAYLGEAPILFSAQLYYTPPQGGDGTPAELKGSQMWHLDYDDRRQMIVFFYPRGVGEENGPLTMLHRSRTAQVPNTIIPDRVSDQVMEGLGFSKEAVRCTGEAGTCYVGDTSACYHFGSRSKSERAMLTVKYTTKSPYLPRRLVFDGVDASGLTPLQRGAIV